jgi:PAS domain S-box-containing protein
MSLFRVDAPLDSLHDEGGAPPVTVRVIIADDDAAIRDVLEELLSKFDDIEVLGVAAEIEPAVVLARSLRPDVAIVDVRMRGGGATGARAIQEVAPGCAVLAFSAYQERTSVLEMLLAGASGYLVKGAPPTEIVEAVRRAAREQATISVDLLTDIVGQLARDVEQRVQSEEVLRRSEERFRALLESAPDAAVVVDDRGRIVLVNRQTEELFGYTREEMLDHPIELLLPERFRSIHTEHRRTYVGDPRTRPMGVGLELAGRRADGSEFPVDISLSSIQTSDGLLATAFVRDVTERVRSAKELRTLEQIVHAEEERRALLAHLVRAQEDERARIASDIHDDSIQVMAAASMRLQILRSELADPAHRAMLTRLEETVLASIARLRHLLFELRPRILDSDGLGAALRLYMDELGPDVGFEVSFEDRLRQEPTPDIRVIVYRIAQEAVTNVRKHAKARHMSVTLDSDNGGVLLRVLDDGEGLPSDIDESQPGHLGLAAIRERAELTGGWTRLSGPPEGGVLVEAWVPDETLEDVPVRPESERTILLP